MTVSSQQQEIISKGSEGEYPKGSSNDLQQKLYPCTATIVQLLDRLEPPGFSIFSSLVFQTSCPFVNPNTFQ
jgi:hypothetical protein